MKVSIHLTKLVHNEKYEFQIAKILKVDQLLDIVNVYDHETDILFGLAIEGSPEYIEVPSFYLIFKLHEFILHNAMLDYGTSHNLMPKPIIQKLGLDITGP